MDTTNPNSLQLLTPEEAAQVDAALLTSQEKFTTRVALYALRSLKQIAQEQGIAIAQVTEPQIFNWIEQDEQVQQEQLLNVEFTVFFTRLIAAALRRLRQISKDTGTAIEDLTPKQAIAWFEQNSSVKQK